MKVLTMVTLRRSGLKYSFAHKTAREILPFSCFIATYTFP